MSVDATHGEVEQKFRRIHNTYLGAYAFAALGDWLQGPYLYALYRYYGLSRSEIQSLFVAGFTTSMIMGTVVGCLADKYGRRLNCITYCILYALGCWTKHSKSYQILLIGRFCGGISTSILWSAFESWMVCQHMALTKASTKEQLDGHLKRVFTNATMVNSAMAIIAGLGGQLLADMFSYVTTFDAAAASLMVCMIVMIFKWDENYGDQSVSSVAQLMNCLEILKTNKIVLYLGIIQSCFEAAMYCFVLEWTPALEDEEHPEKLPHGAVFASFMVSIMIGSWIYRMCTSKRNISNESMLVGMLVVAMSCMLSTPLVTDKKVRFVAFCCFEACIGIFWPALGTLRSLHIPEDVRSTMMNMFRVPLNMLVIMMLMPEFSLNTVFYISGLLLGTALVFAKLLAATPTKGIESTPLLSASA